MKVERFDVAGPALLTPALHGDHRGSFTETFKASLFHDKVQAGVAFVQDNQSVSARAGTVRGLHYQTLPHAQGKLVRVLRGAILDVAVDLRAASPTFGRHVAVELSAVNRRQLWIPAGFAHGFCTLADNTEVIYKVTAEYSAAHDRGLLWNDPTLAIGWPVDDASAILSDKDRHQPTLAAVARDGLQLIGGEH